MINMDNIDLSVVIACYNESKRVPATLEDIANFSQANPTLRLEVIVVNDGSKDNTLEILQSYTARFPWLKIITYEINRGKGYAVKQGMLASSGEHVVFMDADNSTNVREYLNFLPLTVDYDVIMGSRYLPGSNLVKQPGLSRLIISRTSNLLVRIMLGINFHDTQCGFKLFKHSEIEPIFNRQTIERFGFDMEIIMIAQRLGLKIKEQPVTWVDDPNSTVNPIRDTLRTFQELLRIRRNLTLGRYK